MIVTFAAFSIDWGDPESARHEASDVEHPTETDHDAHRNPDFFSQFESQLVIASSYSTRTHPRAKCRDVTSECRKAAVGLRIRKRQGCTGILRQRENKRTSEGRAPPLREFNDDNGSTKAAGNDRTSDRVMR